MYSFVILVQGKEQYDVYVHISMRANDMTYISQQ